MGPTHPPPPAKERAFVWDSQMEHLPAELVPLGPRGHGHRSLISPCPVQRAGNDPRLMLFGSPDSKRRSSTGINGAAEQTAALFPEKMLSPSLLVNASSPLAAPRSSLQPHRPRCNPGFCPLWLPLQLLGDRVTARTKAVRDAAHGGDTVLSPAALWCHHFLSLPGLRVLQPRNPSPGPFCQ